jgi:hypothetical protein
MSRSDQFPPPTQSIEKNDKDRTQVQVGAIHIQLNNATTPIVVQVSRLASKSLISMVCAVFAAWTDLDNGGGW